MKKLGVIGGMGPLATAIFMETVIEMTAASGDNEHISMDIINIPSIPDRTAYILGKSQESPVDEIIRVREELEARGADVLAMPCNTAFYFYNDIVKESKIPLIHAIDETAVCLKEAGIKCVGILATDGTIQTGLFQKVLKEHEIQAVIPDAECQSKVMSMIYEDVKAGRRISEAKVRAVEEHLRNAGAECLVLGCTELTVLKRCGLVKMRCLDTLEVMARKAVMECGVLKEKYKKLI